jgi:hypothetical protein
MSLPNWICKWLCPIGFGFLAFWVITKPLYEATQDLIINTWRKLDNKNPSKFKGLLVFALALVILNLDKLLKLKGRKLYSKRGKFCNLWIIFQSYKMMSHWRRLTKLFAFLQLSVYWILNLLS